MAQHDYQVADGLGATVRDDLNDVLAAIVSSNSGQVAPGTLYPGMLWLDTLAPETLKLRNAQNTDWLPVAVGAGFLPLTGGTITGNLAVAGIFTNPDFTLMRGSYAGTAAPSAPFAGQLWYDTSTTAGKLKIRDASNAAWLDVVDLSSPNFTDQVTINSVAGNSQLNLVASSERRRIVNNEAGKRLDFYGPADQVTAYLSDAGDWYLPALGNWLSVYMAALQPSIGWVPVRQYDGSTIHIGGNPARLYVNGADQGVINTTTTQNFMQFNGLGSFAAMKPLSGTALHDQVIAGSGVTFYPPTNAAPAAGSWRCMEYQIASTSFGCFHRVA